MKSWALFRLTIFEAIRRGTLIAYFALGTIVIVAFAIWLKRSPSDPNAIILFGNLVPNMVGSTFTTAQFLLLAHFTQSTSAIILLGTFGTVGLMTSLLDKGTIELYVSKPMHRWQIFLSRAFGATAGASINVIYYIAGIWLIFGLKIGVWNGGFLISGILVAFAFVCYYSIVSFVGILTRSAVFSNILGLMFSFISTGLELREKTMYKAWDNVIYHRFLDTCYYCTPQLDGMLTNASKLIGRLPLSAGPSGFSASPFLYSLLSATLFYYLSARYFTRQDF